jgi:hypothetical protein
MIRTVFLSGARVDEFVHIKVEDLHLDADLPQSYLVTARKNPIAMYQSYPPSHRNCEHIGRAASQGCSIRDQPPRSLLGPHHAIVVKAAAQEAGIDKCV